MIRKTMKSLALAVALMLATATTALAVAVGGGEWSYGTYITGVAYSNYYHASRTHGSSVMVESDVVRSPCMAAKATAKAEKFRLPWQSVHHYWRHC